MKEQDLIDSLAEAERLYADAKIQMAVAKRAWVDAESAVIEARINRDRIREELRVFRKTTPNQAPTSREIEIQEFRDRNPECIDFARERDKNRGKE